MSLPRPTSTSRTDEFRACVQSIRLRSSTTVDQKSKGAANGLKGKRAPGRTEFALAAGKIADGIKTTTERLEKLAKLAKRKTLFDDRPVEISELTFIIKRDISELNAQILSLQNLTRNQPPAKVQGGKQVDEHNNNVVMMLQSKLANTSMGFKDVLEIRTQNMKASKDRSEQFMYSGSNGQVPAGPSSVLRLRKPSISSTSPLYQTDSPLYSQGRSTPLQDVKGKGKAVDYPGGGGYQELPQQDFLALDMGGNGGPAGDQGNNYMQMQLMEPQSDQYLHQRSTAIESIESTIAELGQIFSQLAQMVAQQGETVQRIDADTSDIANNVSGAQRELLKFYANMSSNRWLMLQIMGVLIIFFLLFVLVT